MLEIGQSKGQIFSDILNPNQRVFAVQFSNFKELVSLTPTKQLVSVYKYYSYMYGAMMWFLDEDAPIYYLTR